MSKAKCLKCNDIIESKHRHDFVRCSCNDNLLDEDLKDFNLGFQAGVMNERERIIRAFEQYKGIKPLIDWTIKIVKGEQ